MAQALVAFVLAVFQLLGYRPTRERVEIARGIVDAELELAGEAPVYTSHNEDLVTSAFFAVRESSLDNTAVGDGGRAHGVFQLHGACGTASIAEQARCWRRLLRDSPCRDHPIAAMWGKCEGRLAPGVLPVELLAVGRERRVRELLDQVLERSGRDAMTRR